VKKKISFSCLFLPLLLALYFISTFFSDHSFHFSVCTPSRIQARWFCFVLFDENLECLPDGMSLEAGNLAQGSSSATRDLAIEVID